MRRSPSRRAFSLLEVMVAIAILGLVLTVILSAQGGSRRATRWPPTWGRRSPSGAAR